MKRSKAWWAALTTDERAVLVGLERAEYHSGSGWNLPTGYSDCGWCSTPTSGGGLCLNCIRLYQSLVSKANASTAEAEGGNV